MYSKCKRFESFAQETVNRAESSSKFKEKMENALGILNFINDQHSDKPIKQIYWGYRTKPTGVPKGHPGDMFIEYTDKKMLGVSLKCAVKKQKNHNSTHIIKQYLLIKEVLQILMIKQD